MSRAPYRVRPPITRTPLRSEVRRLLLEEIVRGDLAPSEGINEAELSSRLGVSRTPLREALRMLQREGLVISQPNHRVRIAELSGDDAEELYIMRIALECVAIRITVPRLTSSDFAELEGYMAQMDHYMRSEDRYGLRVPHRAFHDRLVRGAGERVAITIGQLFDHAERYRNLSRQVAVVPREDEHRKIVTAALGRRLEETVELSKRHVELTAEIILGLPSLSAPPTLPD